VIFLHKAVDGHGEGVAHLLGDEVAHTLLRVDLAVGKDAGESFA
jgi:hypothetical protein